MTETPYVRPAGRLRIAYVVDVFDDNGTGGVRSARRFVDELAKRNDVRVVTSGAPQPNHIILPNFTLPFVRRLMEENGFRFAWPRRAPIEAALREADVVHIQLPFLLGFRSLWLARRLGVPVVAAHHIQPENVLYNLRLPKRWAGVINRFLVRHFYNRCAAVVCPSPFAESELKRAGLQVPGVIISNGLVPHYRPANCPRPPRRPDDEFTLLMVGRLAREKRHDVVLEAVAQARHHPRVQLIITGRGPLRENIIRQGNLLPRPPEVRFVSDDELLDLYQTADLMVHASEVELEGMSVLEAMGCGLPVLVSDAPTSAARQFALDERFLFRSGDSRHLAERLDYWIEHPGELHAARSLYLERVKPYTLADSIQRLEATFEDVRRRRAALGS